MTPGCRHPLRADAGSVAPAQNKAMVSSEGGASVLRVSPLHVQDRPSELGVV